MKNTFILNTSLVLFSTCILLSGCKKSEEAAVKNPTSDASAAALINATPAQEAVLATNSSSARMASNTYYIRFDDKGSCQYSPYICTSGFVMWPGYIQRVVNQDWAHAWMSKGPRTNFLPDSTGDHYHIAGLAFPDLEPNPHAYAMFGTDWFAFYMQRNNIRNRTQVRINFNLTQILVHNIPITLWYKQANGHWMYWAKLNPGRWNLPGATNIQEFHIRAASGESSDHWEIDDIAIQSI